MTTPGSMSAALAFLPQWWQETVDPTVFDALLAGWGRACGWMACGFVWASENGLAARTVHGTTLVNVPSPIEAPDALRRIKAGETTVVYSVAGSGGRGFAAVQPAGRTVCLLWADKPAGQPWTETERSYLALVGKILERSPAVAAVIGPVIDPDRLLQRLGDAAVIAGRMAHDFDNLLQGIIGFSDLAFPLLPPGSQAAHFVGEIGKIGQRGIAFTQQLHTLSRSAQAKPTAGSVPLAIVKEETRLRSILPPGVRVERDFAPNLPAVAVEAGPLQTILGHVLENAIEACSHGGVVRIGARAVELTDTDARTYLGRVGVGAHLQVTISDTGPGITPEMRRRLFVEPFFTTKVRHRGLGLAITYRTLWAHRGGLQLESVPPPGSGTLVRVVLPLAAARPPVVPTHITATTAVGG